MIIPPLPVEGQDRRRYIIPKLPVAHSPAAPPLPLAQSGGDNGRSLPSFSTYLDTARATQQPSSPYLPTQILEAILRQDTQMPANNSLTQCSVLLAAESTARDPSGGCWLDSASSAFERGESKSVGGGSKSVEGESERRQAKRRHRANRRSRRIEQQGGFGHPKLQDFACCSRPAHQSLPNIQVAPTPLRAFTEPQVPLKQYQEPAQEPQLALVLLLDAKLRRTCSCFGITSVVEKLLLRAVHHRPDLWEVLDRSTIVEISRLPEKQACQAIEEMAMLPHDSLPTAEAPQTQMTRIGKALSRPAYRPGIM